MCAAGLSRSGSAVNATASLSHCNLGVVSRTTGLDRKSLNCNMVALAERPCIPCRGGVEPLTPDECARYLTELPDWELRKDGRYLARRFRFRDYRNALAFANAVSALAEETWHHPELALGFGFCEVSLTTRKIGGLHESNFVMAARIDALATGPLDSAWLPPLPPPKRAKG